MKSIRPSLHILYIGLVVISLQGCLHMNKPAAVARYSLPDHAPGNSAMTSSTVLLLAPLQLADYLDSDQIIIQMSDTSLHRTRDHLWADSLSAELMRGLRSRLATRLPQTAVTERRASVQPTWILHVRFDQFQGNMEGYALISGQWYLESGAGSTQPQIHDFSLKTPLAETGYPALVRALGNNLDLLSDQIMQCVKPAV